MDAGDPTTWRWIWLAAMVVFGVGEMATAGTFFLAPFAAGAAVAALLAFFGVNLAVEWVLFLAVSAGSFLAMRPIARRLDADGPMLGIGSNRQLGQRAVVTEAVGGDHKPGMVLLGADRWRAESADGRRIDPEVAVVVTEVKGTRLVVRPFQPPEPDSGSSGLDAPSK